MRALLAVGTQGQKACEGVSATGGDCGTGGALLGYFSTISNTLIFLVGAIAVIMVIIGALRYVLSNGDAAGFKSAKDTILYALVGVVIAIISYALVQFIIARVSS